MLDIDCIHRVVLLVNYLPLFGVSKLFCVKSGGGRLKTCFLGNKENILTHTHFYFSAC